MLKTRLIFLFSFTITLPMLAMDNPIAQRINGNAIDSIESASTLLEEYLAENPIVFPTPNKKPVLHPMSWFYQKDFNYKNIFNERQFLKIDDILSCYNKNKSGYNKPFIYANEILQRIEGITLSEGGWCSKLANLAGSDDLILKVTCSLSEGKNPFSSPLRVFNGIRMQKLIDSNNWDMLHVPKEGLVPLISENEFLQLLDESQAPYAFLIASEKVKINETINLLNLSPKEQIRAAIQLCLLIVSTNLEDASFVSNIVFTDGKINLIDNEPLFESIIATPPDNLTDAARKYCQPFENEKLSAENCVAMFLESNFLYYKKYKDGKAAPQTGLYKLYETAICHDFFIVGAVAEMFFQHYGSLALEETVR